MYCYEYGSPSQSEGSHFLKRRVENTLTLWLFSRLSFTPSDEEGKKRLKGGKYVEHGKCHKERKIDRHTREYKNISRL